VGDISWLQRNYNFEKVAFEIDELIVLDISRANRDRNRFCNTLKQISTGCFVPISAGGGIKSLDDAQVLFNSGADKIVLNTAMFLQPNLINQISNLYGKQSIVGAVDVLKTYSSAYRVAVGFGQQLMSENIDDLMAQVSESSIGEIMIQSINQDGTGQGLDLATLDLVPKTCDKPLILLGGVGNSHHLDEGLNNSRVSAVSTANLFNFVGDGFSKARKNLINRGHPFPIWDSSMVSQFRNRFRD